MNELTTGFIIGLVTMLLIIMFLFSMNDVQVITEEKLVKQNLGYYNTGTGDFILKDLKESE